MPLQSLSQIRGNAGTPSSTSDGLVSLSTIRQNQENQALAQRAQMDKADEAYYQAQPQVQPFQPPPVDVNQSPLMQQIQQTPPQPSSSLENIINELGSRPKPGVEQAPILQLPNYVLTKAQEGALPDSYLGGASDAQGFTSPRANFAATNPVDTGSAFLNKVGDYAGNLGSMLVPIGGGSPIVNDASKVVDKLAGTQLGQKVEQGLGNIGAGVANKLNLSPDIIGKALQNAAHGAATGAIYGATAPFTYGSGDLSQVPGSVVENALGFAGGEAALPIFGTVAKYAGTKIGDVLGRFFSQSAPEISSPAEPPLGLPRPGETAGSKPLTLREGTAPSGEPIPMPGEIYKPPVLELPQGNYTPPQRLRIKSGEDAFQSVYQKVLPAAQERMTPPLENPNELAKWVQKGLNDAGHDVSLNQVRELTYEDMRTLGEEMRTRMQKEPYNVVRQTAHDMGYGKIFDQTAPSLSDRIAQDAQSRVYGVPAEPVNLRKPAFNIVHENGATGPRDTIGIRQRTPSRVGASSRIPDAITTRTETPITGANVKEPIQTGPRLQSLSEVKAARQEEAIKTEVQPEPRIRDKVVQFMDEKATAAQKRIDARRNLGFLPAVQGNDFVDHAIIGAAHIVKSGVTYADYSEFMIKKFGNDIKSHLPQIYQQSVQLAKKDAKLSEKDIDRTRNIAKFAENNKNNAIPDTRKQITTKTKRESMAVADVARQAYIKNIDDVHRLSNFDKYVSDVLGRDLKATEKTHILALNSRSSDVISNHILTSDMVDSKGRSIGESFKAIVKQIPKGKQGEFEDYVINKHAETRMKRGEKVFSDDKNMSPEKSAQIVENYESRYPKFKEIAQQYYDFNRRLGQAWLVDTGLIPQEAFDAWGRENPYYVPMQRKFSDLEKSKTFNTKSGGYGNQAKTVQGYSHVGSQRQIISPIESTIEQIDRYVKTAKRNEVIQAMIRNISKKPDDFEGWAQIVGKEKMDMNKVLDEEGIDGVLNQVDEPLQQAQIKNDLTKSNIVNGLMDGEKVHLQVNDAQLLDALSNLHPNAQNFVIAALGRVTRMMKTLTTGFNPLFSLTRNIFRDIPEAYKNSTTTNNPVKFAFDLVHAIGSEIAHGDLSEGYKAVGGGHSGNISAGRNLLSQSKNQILQADTIGKRVTKGVRSGFHALENFNSALEQGPRLGEYKRSVKQGGGSYNAKVQGLYNANDVTVNFNRRGQISKDIDAIFPYYNAAIQGLDKWVRSFSPKDPKQMVATVLKSVAAITIPQMALYEVNKNDPNYQKLSNYTKDNYFCIPKGDGTFYKIPKPRETGFIFGTLVERAMQKYEQQDPEAFKGIGSTIKNVFAPPGVSGMIDTENSTISPTGALGDSIVGPGVNILQNKDFAGRAIVPNDLVGLSPRLQYDSKTSNVAKSLGNILNKSPKQIDYLIKSYGGVIGQIGIPANTVGNGGNALSRIGNAVKQNVTADPTYSNDIASNFYTQKGKYDQATKDAKAQGTVSDSIGISSYLDQLSTAITKIRNQTKMVQNSKSLSDSQKQTQLKDLQIQMNNMQQQALDAIKPKAAR